ncbi:hypothetical protein IQ07DRAFT_591088 [Pyrenochaeta sp. DS3sAY3a]|nr:hypothetical protein IQ07DRAFT_591088 [Pyrenochaeta sp. DS3sAY3a]
MCSCMTVVVVAVYALSSIATAIPTMKRGTLEPKAATLRCGEHGYDGGHAAYIAIFKSNLLLAYTQLGRLVLGHYISRIIRGSTSA